MNTATVWRWFTAACVRVGLKASPHWFRHAHASHALEHNEKLHVVQATLGHANLATTSRYVHVRPGASSGDSLVMDKGCRGNFYQLQFEDLVDDEEPEAAPARARGRARGRRRPKNV